MTDRRIVVKLLGVSLMVLMALGAAPAGPPSAPQHDVFAHDPRRVLVAFHPDADDDARAAVHAAEKAQLEASLPWLDVDVVRIPPGSDPFEVVARYERNRLVAYAEPNWRSAVSSQSFPDDPLFPNQWGLHNTTINADIDGPEGWNLAFGTGNFPSSGGVRVGILDTGIDVAHVDLLGKTVACASAVTGTGTVVEGFCSDDNGHGTVVSGVVGAVSDNGLGIAGVAPDTELAVFKAVDAAGFAFNADLVAGIRWLRTTGRAAVINISVTSDHRSEALAEEIADAYSSGVLVVGAAGNCGPSCIQYPAALPEVVSVGAFNQSYEKPSFSPCNESIEVVAPGTDVWSTLPGNTYLQVEGTSIAAAHASGVLTMILTHNAGVSGPEARDILASTAVDRGLAGWDGCYGYGAINLEAALSADAPDADPSGTIVGEVTDRATKEGIALATVTCDDTWTTETDSAGAYSLAGVTTGTWTCTASATGYRSDSQSVTVIADETTTADFRLRRDRSS